ncbi:glycosyltransferase family A protein [uncultured Lutibacter sp.]|uniref:glycosyltransferase family 2 protein n=1 Tax=uncultured Lutibacter sp. TaxID=437739 RepID=UPI00262CB7A1|nr:glycosyltransferase family A protein [uncultured Lutibacter sp.]
MNQSPLVSVIIPTYNRASYLRETLNSVVNQSYSNIEIIVVDDGSPNDDSKLICTQFEKVTYIKINNSGGPAKPRNIGIKKAKGKYLAFIDDDDLWIPSKIEEQVKVLEKHSDFGLVHGYCQIINSEGNLTENIIGKPGSSNVKHGVVSFKMIGSWTLMTSSVLIRKKLIDKIGFFNEKMPPAGEDVEYWVRCSFQTKFFDIQKVVVWYRKHENNISKQEERYIDLPLSLNMVLIQSLKSKIITKQTYLILKGKVAKMQLKMIKKNSFKTISNLFSIDAWWFLKFGNIKLLIYKLLTK